MEKGKAELQKGETRSSRLSNIKGMLTRDELRQVTGGYIVCYGYCSPCCLCTYQGQFVPDYCGF